jgi:hypothetical protein
VLHTAHESSVSVAGSDHRTCWQPIALSIAPLLLGDRVSQSSVRSEIKGHAVRSVSQRCAAIRGNVRPSASTAGAELTEESPMTLFIFTALTAVAAAIWVITAPQSPQDPTMDEVSQLIALGFIP